MSASESIAVLDRGSRLAEARDIVGRARRTRRARPRRVALVLSAVTFGAFCVSLAVGAFPIPLTEVVPALLGIGDPGTVVVVQELRLPRALVGMFVGISFGLSGAIFQAVARNPLASPDILGISSGASLAAVFVITTVGTSFIGVYAGALFGAVVIAALVYALAYKQGVSPYRFVLVGIGLGAMAAAMIGFLLITTNVLLAANASVWLTGSLNAVGWETVPPTGLVVLVLSPTALVLAHRLGVLQLGDETSAGLGVGVERSRALLLVVAVGLVGVAVASGGPIQFVAFMGGPIARRLTRSPLTLVSAGLVGAFIVLVSDSVGRLVFSPSEIPVGIVTAVVGAPFLLWLLARANKVGSEG